MFLERKDYVIRVFVLFKLLSIGLECGRGFGECLVIKFFFYFLVMYFVVFVRKGFRFINIII